MRSIGGKRANSGHRNNFCRRLVCEPLEDRRLLSVSISGKAAPQVGKASITAVPALIAAATPAATPTISDVVVVTAKGLMTWSTASVAPVVSSTLTVDGTPVAVSGPFATATGANFSGFFGNLGTGTHTFNITATDNLGNTSSLPGSFSVFSAGPVISNVTSVSSQGLLNWTATPITGATVIASTLSVDGTPVSPVSGPVVNAAGGFDFSAATGHLSVGVHNYTITATDNLGNTTQAAGTFRVATSGPTISSIVPVPSQGLITWNVQSASTVLNTTLSVDGAPITQISGPFVSSTGGVNFSGFFGSLPVGTHTFIIGAFDSSGNSSQATGSFSVTATTLPPIISQVVVLPSQGILTWNVQSTATVAGSSLTIDSAQITNISGPFPSSSGGVNFSGAFGALSAGTHTFVITATDSLGNTSQSTGSFSVTAANPTISSVVTVPASGFMTWNVQSAGNVTSSTLTIDGSTAARVSGPFASTTGGVNFKGVFGALPMGTHTFTITATDSLGGASRVMGSFNVAAQGPTISSIVTQPTQGRLTFNVQSSATVSSTSVTVDGTMLGTVSGPYSASTGSNYSAFFGSLAQGSHSFTISATDNLGNVSQVAGSFTVQTVTPVISSVVIRASQGFMTWNAQVAGGNITATTLAVDSVPVTGISGPFPAALGSNFSGAFGQLTTGTHVYTITATDDNGVTGQASGLILA